MTERVEIWRKNYFYASVCRLTFGGLGGLFLLILISLHTENNSDLECEVTRMYKGYQFEVQSLNTANILTLWIFYLFWTAVSLHFMLVSRQYIRDPIVEREAHSMQLL